MIGHYLLTLTQEQEDRVLTQQFEGFNSVRGLLANTCLVQITEPRFAGNPFAAEMFMCRGNGSPANCYDNLTYRFGTERINAAIRNRILSNQARRALVPEAELVAV